MTHRPNPAALWLRQALRKAAKTSRRSRDYVFYLSGAAIVAGMSMLFAKLADLSLQVNGELISRQSWLVWLLLPLGLPLIRYLTLRHAPQTAGSGIPHTIAALEMTPVEIHASGFLSMRQGLFKVALVCLGLLCGASIGREGPSVQVGAAAMLFWASLVGRRLRVPSRTVIVAGAAGGLAAAFNTPLAGIVFAMEELGKGSRLRANWFLLASILCAGFISLAVHGNYRFFPITHHETDAQPWLWVLLAGGINGLLGGLFARLLLDGMPKLVPTRYGMAGQLGFAAVMGLLLAALATMTAGATLGTGYAPAHSLLNDGAADLHGFGLAKLAATVFSYAAGIPGGIFTPSLAIGAGVGDQIALLFRPEGGHQMAVVLSMTAFLAAATQAPITACVIVMEMTRSEDAFLYLMAAAALAATCSRLIQPAAFYHEAARRLRDGWRRHGDRHRLLARLRERHAE